MPRTPTSIARQEINPPYNAATNTFDLRPGIDFTPVTKAEPDPRLHEPVINGSGVVLDPELTAKASKAMGMATDAAKAPLASSAALLGELGQQVKARSAEFTKDGPVDQGTAKLRVYALWALVVGLGVTSLKSSLDFVKALFDPKANGSILLKFAEMFLGWTMLTGAYNTVSNNGKMAFDKMKTILLGSGLFAGLKMFNSSQEGASNPLSKLLHLVPEGKSAAEALNKLTSIS